MLVSLNPSLFSEIFRESVQDNAGGAWPRILTSEACIPSPRLSAARGTALQSAAAGRGSPVTRPDQAEIAGRD